MDLLGSTAAALLGSHFSSDVSCAVAQHHGVSGLNVNPKPCKTHQAMVATRLACSLPLDSTASIGSPFSSISTESVSMICIQTAAGIMTMSLTSLCAHAACAGALLHRSSTGFVTMSRTELRIHAACAGGLPHSSHFECLMCRLQREAHTPASINQPLPAHSSSQHRRQPTFTAMSSPLYTPRYTRP